MPKTTFGDISIVIKIKPPEILPDFCFFLHVNTISDPIQYKCFCENVHLQVSCYNGPQPSELSEVNKTVVVSVHLVDDGPDLGLGHAAAHPLHQPLHLLHTDHPILVHVKQSKGLETNVKPFGPFTLEQSNLF